MSSFVLFGLVLTLIFCFAMTNGFLDGGGLVSTVITTRAMDPLPALILVACCEVVGAVLLGHAVVRTIGTEMIQFPPQASQREVLCVLFSAMSGALLWNTLMWKFSLPTSSSHALLGGLVGATWAHFGSMVVGWTIVTKVFIGLAVVPLFAAITSLILGRFIYWAGEYLTPAVSGVLRVLHVASLAGVALVHGSNDAQKSLAVILMALIAFGWAAPASQLPMWVGLLCGMTIGMGVVFGSRRTVQAVGQGLYRVQSLQGLCAEMTSMIFVGASSLAGFPMSSSHVMSSSVIGAGAAVRPKAVRWDVVGSMLLAWVFTVPAAALLSAFFSYVVPKAF